MGWYHFGCCRNGGALRHNAISRDTNAANLRTGCQGPDNCWYVYTMNMAELLLYALVTPIVEGGGGKHNKKNTYRTVKWTAK